MRDVNRVGVLTDTTASIPLALAKELQIDLVPALRSVGEAMARTLDEVR